METIFKAPRVMRRVFCLNRTMQYGNSNDEINKEIDKISLNRTMQYGNFAVVQIPFADPALFKSYYVVWKLVFLHTREFSCSYV